MLNFISFQFDFTFLQLKSVEIQNVLYGTLWFTHWMPEDIVPKTDRNTVFVLKKYL